MSEISENNKRIAKNTIMLYIRMLFTMSVGLYTGRVILHVLGAVNYGIYNVVGGVVVLFSFLNSTMAVATQRFLTFEIGRGDDEQLKRVFNASFVIHIVIGIIVVVVAETIGLWFLNDQLNIPEDRMAAARIVYHISVFSTILGITQVPYNALIIAREKMDIFAYISILEVLLKLVMVYVISKINYDKLELYAWFIFLNNTIVLLIYRIYCIRSYKESRFCLVTDVSLYKHIGSFAGWNLIANMVLMLRTQGVNMLVNVFGGPIYNAARGIGVQVNGYVLQFVSNFTSASVPQITKLYANKNNPEMLKLVYRSSKFSYLLLVFLMIPLIVETEYVLRLWLGDYPAYTVSFTRLTLIATLADLLSGTIGHAALATGKVKRYQLFMSSLLSLSFILSLIALKSGFTIESVYFVEIMVYLCALCLRLRLLKKMVGLSPVDYFRKVVCRCLIVLAVPLFFSSMVTMVMADSFMRFITVCLCSTSLALLMSYFVGLDMSERHFVFTTVGKYLSKVRKHG